MQVIPDVGTTYVRTTPKAPNRKRALEYLAASGAVPISIIERDGVCSIHAGGKIAGTIAAGSPPRWLACLHDAGLSRFEPTPLQALAGAEKRRTAK
jgi:hypothetical protein